MAMSMTGFGAGRATDGDLEAVVELRTVNHRGVEVRLRLPAGVGALHAEIAASLRDALRRGHIEATVELRSGSRGSASARVDVALGRAVASAAHQLASALDMPAEQRSLPLGQLLAWPGVLELSPVAMGPEAAASVVRDACASALAAALASRRLEGQRLAEDLLGRLDSLRATVLEIEGLAAQAQARTAARLREKVAESGLEAYFVCEPGRVAAEVVQYCERSDIAEELVRFRAHLDAIAGALSDDEGGRAASFLTQELLREVNTIASKVPDAAVAQQAVAAKVEIEKIREQVQNLV